MNKNCKKQQYYDGESVIDIITPKISLEPPVEYSPNKFSEVKSWLSNPDTECFNHDYNEFSPIIVEASLKKSSRFYTPIELRKPKKKLKNNKMTVELSNNECIRKKLRPDSSIITSIPEFKNSLNSVEGSDSDIPKALEDFYKEIQNEVQICTEKSSKNNKNRKKVSSLTVDNSLKDLDNFINVIQQNSILTDNLTVRKQNIAEFFSLENKVILIMQQDTQFTFLGKLVLKVLYGAVELYGDVFNPENTVKSVEIYSPRGYSSISISTFYLDGTYNKEALWDTLTSEGVDRSLNTKLHEAVNKCQSGFSVLILENLNNSLTNFLNTHCSFKLFPKVDNLKYPWCDPRRAECVLQANFQFSKSENEITITPQWNENITKKLQNEWNSKKILCTLIAGGKGVGKSTTVRYLINSLLKITKKVILMDLDPGQSELTPAACVSLNIVDMPLLGPNFTHLKTPIYQLYLEDINVVNCITRYIECVEKLVDCLKNSKDFNHYPVIVNTMGFCKGLGLEICIFLIKLIQPTNVIQIVSKRLKNNFDFALLKQKINEHTMSNAFWNNHSEVLKHFCDYELHYIQSMAEGQRQFETWNMEPRQQRELSLLSYLSKIIENADDKCFCNFTSKSINNIIPYILPFSSFYISLTKSSISPTHILAAMNGNIVALCGIELDDDTSASEKESFSYPMVIIKPPPCSLYGYGIVRGIDMQRRCIFVNTPLNLMQLQHVNLLTGCSAVPFNLLHSVERTSGPYAGDRGELPTSREARRGYFRVD